MDGHCATRMFALVYDITSGEDSSANSMVHNLHEI